MWSPVLLLGVLFPPAILGLGRRDLEFSADYFHHRNVKFICLLSCEQDNWAHSFVKQAAKHESRVSVCARALSLDTTCLQACLLQNYVSVGVLVSTMCDEFEQIMFYASENRLFDSKHHWLILHSSQSHIMKGTVEDLSTGDVISVLNITEKLNISVDTDISLAIPGPKTYEIYELFNFGKIQGGNLNIRKSGYWSTDKGVMSNLNEYKYYRRYNFHQWSMRFINVVSILPEKFDPKAFTDRRPTPGVATFSKTSSTILRDIADIHNFSFVHSITDRWVRKFTRNESKILSAATSLYLKHQDITPGLRFYEDVDKKVDFVHPPVSSLETRYYYRIPTYGVGKFQNQFLRPLSPGTWLLVIVIIALCAGVLVLSANLERRQSAGQYGFFSAIAFLCQQFFEENTIGTERISSSRHLTMLVTGLFCVLIYNYYTSSVVSWLLNGPPPSISSLQELLESSLDLIYEDVGYTNTWLQISNYYYNTRNAKVEDEIRKKKVLNKKKNAPLLVPVIEGIKLVKDGGFAYHTEVDKANRLIAKTFTKYELCELDSLHSMEETFLYVCLQKNSPYKEFFSWSIMRLFERGIVKCIQHRTVSSAVKREGSCPRALDLGGAAPAFLLLAGGFLLATIIMFIERTIWRRKSGSKVNYKKKYKLNNIPKNK